MQPPRSASRHRLTMTGYAAIWVQDFPLQAGVRGEPPGRRRQACVLAEDRRRQARVRFLNQAARRAGLGVGMTVAQAEGRCPGLRVLLADREAEVGARWALLAAAQGVGATVSVADPGWALIDLRGMDPDQVGDRLQRAWRALGRVGLAASGGWADTPGRAQLAARIGRPAWDGRRAESWIPEFPLALAGLSEEAEGRLDELGLRCLGALGRLSWAEVGERLGPEVLGLWTVGRGRDPSVLRPDALPCQLAESFAWEDPVETLDPVLWAGRRILEALALRLRSLNRLASGLVFSLRLADRSHQSRQLRLPAPTAEAETLCRIFQQAVERVRTESPLVGLSICLEETAPILRQGEVFATGLSCPERFRETLTRLEAILAGGAFGSPRLLDSRRLDAFTLAPADPAWESQTQAPGVRQGLPLRRWRPPLQVEVELLSGVPAFIHSNRLQGPVQEHTGPWVLSGHWWDAGGWERQEWDVRVSPAGLFLLVWRDVGWWVEGRYG